VQFWRDAMLDGLRFALLVALSLFGVSFYYRRQQGYEKERIAADAMRQALQENLNKIMGEQRIILDNASVGITMVRDRKQLWANQKMADIFGYTPDEMANIETERFYLTADDYVSFGTAAYPVLKRGEIYSCEREMRCCGNSATPWRYYL
jgi:PAS domain-containing protein